MFHGIINIKKEKDMTSHDVVAILRGILRQRKIGHTGTLDLDATGVLPVCLGSATKLCELLTDKDKEYEAVLLLGKVTDTQDIKGKVLKENEVNKTIEEVKDTINSFIGTYMQLPPMYSAIKIGGKKLVDLAREGIIIKDRPKREVKIYNIDILDIDLPRVKIKVSCSKGTYIRTLCHDIGEKLQVGACMESLVRTKVDKFILENAITLDEVKNYVNLGVLDNYILSTEHYFSNLVAYKTRKNTNKYAINGNKIYLNQLDLLNTDSISINDTNIYKDNNFSIKSMEDKKENFIRIYDVNCKFLGIYELNKKENVYKPYKMFMVCD